MFNKLSFTVPIYRSLPLRAFLKMDYAPFTSDIITTGAYSALARQNLRRADADRNRKLLLAAATKVFSSASTEPSMRAIAREAGVGIATLYRHFPTMESVVDAVYQDQVVRLTTSAGKLLDQAPPAIALRRWMDLFGSWIATKNGMLDTLLAMIASGEIAHGETRVELLAAISVILDAGRAANDLREDVTSEDVAASLIGIFTVAPKPKQKTLSNRLLDLLMDGLRPQAPRLR